MNSPEHPVLTPSSLSRLLPPVLAQVRGSSRCERRGEIWGEDKGKPGGDQVWDSTGKLMCVSHGVKLLPLFPPHLLLFGAGIGLSWNLPGGRGIWESSGFEIFPRSLISFSVKPFREVA